MMKKFILYIIPFLLGSCCTLYDYTKCVDQDSDTVVTTTVDTVTTVDSFPAWKRFEVPGDTLVLEDSLYCDSAGNVISSLSRKVGYLSSERQRLMNLLENDGTYKVRSVVKGYIDSIEVLEKRMERLIRERKSIETKTVVKYKEKPESNFVKAVRWIGIIALIILLIIVSGYIKKSWT